MGKTLVAYFTTSSATEKTAEKLASLTGADLYEIKALKPYTDDDLNWTDPASRSTMEMNNPECRPEIDGKVENMADYDTVYIGYPVWWGKAPRIIETFVSSYDFAGKTLRPFATSGGSKAEKSDEELHALVSDKAVWKEAKRLDKATDDELKAFIAE